VKQLILQFISNGRFNVVRKNSSIRAKQKDIVLYISIIYKLMISVSD